MADTMFTDLATRVLAEASPTPTDGFDAPLWGAIETTGLDRLLLPENLGGAGDAFEEAVAMMMAFGRAGAALPLADTLIANWCLSKAGLEVPDGPKAFLSEPDIRPNGSGWSGVGYWLPVVSAGVLATGAGDQTLVQSLSDVPGRSGQSISGEPLLWIDGEAGWTPDPGRPADILPKGALALAATLEAAAIVGALERVNTLSIDYANTRKQFGRPIAKFQAVQTLVARLASETAAAHAAVEHAATMLGGQDALFWAGVAKSRASEAAGKATAHAHQVHGAIGYTREYELHRHSRRLWTWRERRGNEHYWNERIGSAVMRRSGQDLWAGLVDGLAL